MKPMIDQAFWSDPDIEGVKYGVKLSALWLMTNSQTSLIGICGASPSRFEFETKLPAQALETTLEALPRAFKRFGNVIWLRNYIRHQFGTGEKLIKNNFFVALSSLFNSVKDPELKSEILAEYPEFEQALQRACQGLTKPKDGWKGKGREAKGVKGETPKIEDCLQYATEIKLPKDEAESFFDHFQSNGWKVGGKAIMKDWKAAMRNWKRRDLNGKNGHTPTSSKPSVIEPPLWQEFISQHDNDAARKFTNPETAPTYLRDEFWQWKLKRRVAA